MSDNEPILIVADDHNARRMAMELLARANVDSTGLVDADAAETQRLERQCDKLRELLVEARGYLDRMGQDGIRQRIDETLEASTDEVSHGTDNL